jgi:hypothetical protein
MPDDFDAVSDAVDEGERVSTPMHSAADDGVE